MKTNSIEKNARHKLYWYRPTTKNHSPFSPYAVINVGKSIAQFIADNGETKYLGFDVEAFFKKLLRSNMKEHSGIPGVVLYNLGILLENDLGLSAEKILLDLSREMAVIIRWDFDVEKSKRFAWDKETPDVCLEFPEHIIRRLEIENEV